MKTFNGLVLPQSVVAEAARVAAHKAIAANAKAAKARHLAKRGRFDVGQLDELQAEAASTSRVAHDLLKAVKGGDR